MKMIKPAILSGAVLALFAQVGFAQTGAAAPATRAEVKAEGKAAVKAGTGSTSLNEAGATKERPKGGPAVPNMPTESRSDVKAEGKAATKAGTGSATIGEAGATAKMPHGGPGKPAGTSGATRAEVKSEGRAAAKDMTGSTAVGEAKEKGGEPGVKK